MPSEIAVPFRVGSDGRIVTVSDPDAQVRQHVLALMNTQPHERVTVPGYGVDSASLLFEPNQEEQLLSLASTLISDAMSTWEPGVELTAVDLDPDNGESTFKIDVEFARRDAADSGTVANSNEAIITAGGIVREVVRG